jgi:tetratricopeptide (TPR) repeat protein
MDPTLLIVFLGLVYVVVFGVMGLLQREGLSTQFTLEGLLLTLLAAAGSFLTGESVNPILFVVFLYLVTMRARLVVDLAHLLSARGRQGNAISMLQVALRLFPDRTARLITYVNMGVVQLRRENPESAKQLLEMALKEGESGGLGYRYGAAGHYNLGLALMQLGQESKAVAHFKEAVESFPGSPYARAAERALARRREGKGASSKAEGQSEEN